MNRFAADVALLLVLAALVGCTAERTSSAVRLVADEDGAWVVEAPALAARRDHGLTVHVAEGSDLPPVLGRVVPHGDGIRFRPRFAFEPGVTYRASWRDADGALRARDVGLPAEPAVACARVAAIYPTAAVLPENQLKFYIHFTEPMREGDAYRCIHLERGDGTVVAAPFLELGEELWDPDHRRFTLYLDPGRVKRGLVPREELGPALVWGERYTLRIDRDWRDARGVTLVAGARKEFRVGAADFVSPTLDTWVVEPPAAGTRAPLRLRFPEPLERALLQRLVRVVDREDVEIHGDVEVGDEETSWSLTPDRPWAAGPHEVVVRTDLEDLAGNSIARPFEVDVFHQVKERVTRGTERLPFTVESR